MEAKIELPRYRGIEEAIADVKDFGLKTGRERLIGLRHDGTRAFDVEGNDHMVSVPDKWFGHCQGIFLIHCHPSMPTELSSPDIMCYTYGGAEGNLAVCSQDGTISWTDDHQGPRNPLFEYMSEMIQASISLQIGGDHVPSDREEDYWKWVLLAHKTNKQLSNIGFLRNYHVWLGDKSRECLQIGGCHDSN